MMSCLHHPHAMRTMMMWCSYNMSCHLISMWHEWNANTGDMNQNNKDNNNDKENDHKPSVRRHIFEHESKQQRQ